MTAAATQPFLRAKPAACRKCWPTATCSRSSRQGGRVLEVTREAKPEIVWEYFNVLDPAAGGKRVGLITHAERFPPGSLPFLTPASS